MSYDAELSRLKKETGGSDYEKANRDVKRMSLSSTASAGLMDVGDLSAVWNRNENAQDADAAILREVEAKFQMDKWLTFLDHELEEEFIGKLFYSSTKAHKMFCLIVAVIFFIFTAMQFMAKEGPNMVVVYSDALLGVLALVVAWLTRYKWFPEYQMGIISVTVCVILATLAVQRRFSHFDYYEDYALFLADERYLNMIYLFGDYGVFMSLRLPFKVAFKVYGFCAIALLACVAGYPIITVMRYFVALFTMLIGSVSVGIASHKNELQYRNLEKRRAVVLRHTEEVVKEKLVTEKLLLNILPNKIAKRLMEGEEVISDGYSQATVLFADLVGWTDISKKLQPTDAIQLLGDIVSTFDRLAHGHKLEKIKTIGDGYLVACGLPESLPPEQSAKTMANFALDMIRATEGLSKMKQKDIQVTLGIHTGPVVAGVIGKTKFLYDLWGDSVNTASRMQSHGAANRIHVTSQVYELLNKDYEFEKRPVMYVKGKGDMQTYFLNRRLTSFGDSKKENEGDIQSITLEPSQEQQITETKEMKPKEEENDGLSKAERKKRKAREAMQKKNEEMEAMMNSQIKSKYLILSFIDPKDEQDFRLIQERECQERLPIFMIFFGVFQMISGFNLLQYKYTSWGDIEKYYMVMGASVMVQMTYGGLAYLSAISSVTGGVAIMILSYLGAIVSFAIFRHELSGASLMMYEFLLIFQVLFFMTSKVPYRYCMRVIIVMFFVFVISLKAADMSLPLDTNGLIFYVALCVFGGATSLGVEKHERRDFLLAKLAEQERAKVLKQREETERLLYNILPESVIQKMREGDGKLIDTYHSATVLFADIVGFTVLSSKLDANSIVKMLNSLFSQFDSYAEEKGLEKIKTIGDAYMVVGGLPYPRPDHAQAVVDMGLEMIRIVQALDPIEGLKVNVRIGINSGNVVGGIIGVTKMVFDIWGENVNIASKMESNGTPGRVNISHITKGLIQGSTEFETEDRDKSITYGSQTINMFYVNRSSDSQAQEAKQPGLAQEW